MKLAKTLIITCAGDNSKHIEDLNDKNIETFIIYYGDSEKISRKYEKNATYFLRKKGCKWQLIRVALEKLKINNLFNKYNFIWLPDDDIQYTPDQCKELIKVMHISKCSIIQPSIIYPEVKKQVVVNLFEKFKQTVPLNSEYTEREYRDFLKKTEYSEQIKDYISHVELLPQTISGKYRIINNIEVQCPFFKSTLLEKIYDEVLGNNKINPDGEICSGWALESIWSHPNMTNNKEKAVIDSVTVIHCNKLSHRSKKNTWYNKFNNDPFKEMKLIKEKYEKIYRTKLTSKPYKTLAIKKYKTTYFDKYIKYDRKYSTLTAKERTITVSLPHSKIVRSYWHFMMGDFLPVMNQVSLHKPTKVIIESQYTDYPWLSFYSEITDKTGIEFIIKKKTGNIADLEAWDYEFADKGEGLRNAVNYLLSLSKKKKKINVKPVFQIRNLSKKSEDFYKSHKDNKININFVHIPKTGGTAIKKALVQRLWKVVNNKEKIKYAENFDIKNENKQDITIYSGGHRTISDMWWEQRIINISTIRDPYTRLASAFYYVKEKAVNHPFPEKTRNIEKWHNYLKPYKSLESLLEDDKAIQYIKRNYTHFYPLDRWIKRDNTIAIDYFIRQTHLQKDLNKLLKSLKIPPVSTDIINKTGRKNKNFDHKSNLSEKSRKLIEKHYPEDIITYNKIMNNIEKNNKYGLDKASGLIDGSFWGKTRRYVTNLKDIAEKMGNEAIITKDDGKSLFEQIEFYSNKKLLVLGHGAGMINILWMPKKSNVIEIISKMKMHEIGDLENGAVQGAKRISEIKGIKLKRIIVPGEHSAVNENKLMKAIHQITGAR